MAEILPAVLPRTFRELEEGLAHLRGVAPWVQIDLVGTNVLAGHTELPQWEEFNFETDIMLPDPAQEIQTCIDAGATRIVVHADAASAFAAVQHLQATRTGEFPIEVGVALRSHDTPEVLYPYAGLYDYVQVMGIDVEGRQGEPPDPHHKELELIKALRAAHPELIIQVDGAAAAHPRELVQAGANRLVVGAAIVNALDPIGAYKELYTLANVSE